MTMNSLPLAVYEADLLERLLRATLDAPQTDDLPRPEWSLLEMGVFRKIADRLASQAADPTGLHGDLADACEFAAHEATGIAVLAGAVARSMPAGEDREALEMIARHAQGLTRRLASMLRGSTADPEPPGSTEPV